MSLPDGPLVGDDRPIFEGFLAWHRSLLRRNLSLLGLVRHMAKVERKWFRERIAGQGPEPKLAAVPVQVCKDLLDPRETHAVTLARQAGTVAYDRRVTSQPDTQYEDLLRRVMTEGTAKSDRTGTGTRSAFAQQVRYDLDRGFPLVTTKRVHFRSVAYELLWFLRGEGNVGWLQEHGVTIWDEWAGPDGDLGPVYGVQWRSWPTPDGSHVDQIDNVLDLLRTDPDSRRMVVSAWNVGEIPQMALPPCHVLFQLHVVDGRVSCHVYQRSADLFLGVPFNIASYALLTHMFAQQAGLGVGELVWTGGDCHIYDNHVDQVREQLSRAAYPFPRLALRHAASLFDYTFEDMEIADYQHHPALRAPVAV